MCLARMGHSFETDPLGEGWVTCAEYCYVQKRKHPISQGRSPEQSPRSYSGDRIDLTLRVVNGTGVLSSGTNGAR